MSQWFYASNGGQAGPVDTAELKALAAAGTLGPDDLVWKEGLADWVPASKIKGLFPAAAAGRASTDAPVPAPADPGPSQSPTWTVAYQEQFDEAGAVPAPAEAPPPQVAPAAAYAAPGGGAGGSTGVIPYVGGSMGSDAPVSRRTIELLSQTRPWVLLCGILLFIIGGLAAIGGIVITLFGIIGAAGSGSAGLGGLGAVVGLVYVAVALLYIVPGLYLTRYAARIATLRAGGRPDQLEHALEAQKSFWRFVGIAVLVVLVIWGVALVVGLAGGALM